MGPEQVGAALRPLPIFLEGRALVLMPQVAQELGLKPGQVVELVGAMVDGRARLLYGDRALQLPGALPFPAGERRAFRVRATAQGVSLEPALRTPPATPEVSGKGPVSPELQLSSLFRQLAAPSFSLAQRADSLDHLFALSAKAPPELQLALPRLSLKDLDGAALRSSLAQSGLFYEALLAQRRPLSPLDLKRALLRVAQAAPANSELARVVQDVTTGLERAQAEAIHATQARQELSLAWVVSFRDGPAIALELERQRQEDRSQPPLWVVHAATRMADLGPLWMRTRFSLGGQVEFTLWAPKAGVAELARGEEAALRQELAALQLQLERFAVHSHPRRDRPIEAPGEGEGA